MPQHKLRHFGNIFYLVLFAAFIAASVFVTVNATVVIASAFVGVRIKFAQWELHLAKY